MGRTKNKIKEHSYATCYKGGYIVVYSCFRRIGLETDRRYKIFDKNRLWEGFIIDLRVGDEIDLRNKYDGGDLWQDDDRFEELI